MNRAHGTYQLHDSANSPLNVHPVITQDSDHARRTADRRKLDECCVVMHQRLEILCAFGDHPVKLARKNSGISGDDLLALSEDRLGIYHRLQKKNLPWSWKIGRACRERAALQRTRQ